MTIYGTKTTKLKVEPISNVCANCGTKHTMDMHIFQKYAHLFSIPFFPTRKTGASLCTHCKQILKTREMPPDLKKSFEIVKAQTTMPAWTWLGVAVLLIAIVASAIIE
jgi:hypothetical protein